MQVIAQTEVPEIPSFMHVGYTSAVATENRLGHFALILIVGAILLHLLQRKRWQWRAGVLAAVVVSSIVLFATIPPATYRNPNMVTHSRARQIYQTMMFMQEMGQPIPSDYRKIKLRNEGALAYEDAWKHDFRVTSRKEGKNTDYRVVSAGEDGRFNTPDDICYPRSPQR